MPAGQSPFYMELAGPQVITWITLDTCSLDFPAGPPGRINLLPIDQSIDGVVVTLSSRRYT